MTFPLLKKEEGKKIEMKKENGSL